MASVEDVHAEIEGRAGEPIRCPICGHGEWEPLRDTILTMLSASHAGFLRANDDENDEPLGDDKWTVFAVGWRCAKCWFLRMHAVEPDLFG